LSAPYIFLVLALAMKPFDGAPVMSLEAPPAAPKPCRERAVVRQHAHLKDAFSIGHLPIKAHADFQPCLANNLGRNGYLIFSSYSSDHGNKIFP
jgi:hypothetical protein